MVNVEIKPIQHRGKSQIGLFFKYNEKLKNQLKELGYVFSQTHCCWYTENNDENKRKLLNKLNAEIKITISGKDRETLKLSANIRSNPTPHVNHSLDEFKKYMQSCRYSERTIVVYINLAKLFLGYFKNRPIDDITNKDFEKFNYEVIIKRKYSSSVQRQLVGVVKLLYRYRTGSSLNLDNLQKARREITLPEVLSPEEILSIISRISNIKHRSIISLIYAAGLRISELINLKISDIDSYRMQIRISSGKGRKDRYVALSEKILNLLRTYFEDYKPNNYLFNGQDKEQYSDESIRQILKEACKKAGIRKKVSPHTLRHSYATHMLENGIDLRYIQELLGHSRPETTMIYTHVTQKKMVSIKSPFDLLFKEGDLTNPIPDRRESKSSIKTQILQRVNPNPNMLKPWTNQEI